MHWSRSGSKRTSAVFIVKIKVTLEQNLPNEFDVSTRS